MGISVTQRCYDQLRVYCVTHRVTASQVVERLLAPVLSGQEPMRSGGLRQVSIPIPEHVAEALRDQQEREHTAGREVEPEQLLEAAIGKMLDSLEIRPWCRTCLEAIEDCACRASAAVLR